MRRVLYVVVYVLLAAVVVSCLRTVWVGVTDVARYRRAFPGAQGALFWFTMLASILAAANAMLIGIRIKGAILANPLIGLVSVILLEMVDGPRSSQVTILVASTLTTAIPWYLWVRRPAEERANGGGVP